MRVGGDECKQNSAPVEENQRSDMSECAALPSFNHLIIQRRTQSKAHCTLPRFLCSGTLDRKLLYGEHKVVIGFPLQKLYSVVCPYASTWVKENHHFRWSYLRCHYFGALANPESVTPSNWVPIVDQFLLTFSIVLAYLAGAIPYQKPIFNYADKRTINEVTDAENTTTSGREAESVSQRKASISWSEVKQKFMNALDCVNHVSYLDQKIPDFDNRTEDGSLSLFAIAEGPRLRLLWVTLQKLHTEVLSISNTSQVASRDVWMAVSCQVIQRIIQPICMQWLDGELSLENRLEEKDLIVEMFKKLWVDDSMLHTLRVSGKTELYADLLFFLRFNSFRCGHSFGSRFFAEHGVDVLEDLVINLADAVSSMYLELISIDSSVTNETSCLDSHLCLLSTRDLQRIRNEVALKQWMQQNFGSIVSMYEDRFDLSVLQAKYLEISTEVDVQKNNWWQKFIFSKRVPSSLCYLLIKQMEVRVKRTKELRALTGWRYYFSLLLELWDILMPLFRAVLSKASNAVTFLLTCLVGRSLGLIYTGIRQSLRWR